jgi:hypothetical protein
MKNLQTWFLKFLITLPLFFSCLWVGAQSHKMKLADSLFRSKQYTQSLELYQSLFKEGEYSSAMLLKMAYIQEGLGKIGQTLYYLKLYQAASDDDQALQKMEELAAKFRLGGYDSNDASRLWQWINKRIMIVQLGLAATLLLISYLMFRSRKKEQRSWLAAGVIILVSASVLFLNNFYSNNSVIVNNDHTYLMEGPSSGAPVAAILTEGNQLLLLGHHDVWLKVKWMDKIVYVKKNSVLTVTL